MINKSKYAAVLIGLSLGATQAQADYFKVGANPDYGNFASFGIQQNDCVICLSGFVMDFHGEGDADVHGIGMDVTYKIMPPSQRGGIELFAGVVGFDHELDGQNPSYLHYGLNATLYPAGGYGLTFGAEFIDNGHNVIADRHGQPFESLPMFTLGLLF